MNFSNPIAFWALLLAIPMIAVYLIRNRPSTRSVSTLLFWEQVVDEPGVTSFFRNLRHPGSLLIQLALLLLLTLALSDPILKTVQPKASHQVLVIDNSASMQAVAPNGVSRFELAIAEATAVIDEISTNRAMSIIVSCPSPQVVCPPTQSRALAKSRLKFVQQTDCTGQIDSAINFASSIAKSSTTQSIVVITDNNDIPNLNTPAATADNSISPTLKKFTVAASPEVSIIKVGQPVANVGLTLFQVRRASTDPTLWHLLYEVSNFTDSRIEINLEIRRDDSLIDVVPLTLQPAESRRDVLTKTSTEGGMIVGILRSTDKDTEWTDALTIDNQATSQLTSRPMIDVTLVTAGNWFLQQALNANPLVRLTVVENYRTSQTAEDFNSIVIFDSVVPQGWPPKDSQAVVKALVVAPSQSCRLWTVNGQIDTTFVGNYMQSHPLVEYVQLEDIAINSASDVTLVGEAKTIVCALEGQPLLSTYESSNARIMMLAINLQRSDLPLRSSFPILLTNALDWLNGSSPEMLPQANTKTPIGIATKRLGARRPLDSSDEPATWALKTPDGQFQNVATVDGIARLGQLTKVGIYSLQANQSANKAIDPSVNDADSILLPCNLVSRQESRLNQPPDTTTSRLFSSVTQVKSNWSIQNILLMMAILGVITECWLWHRRIIE